MVLTKVIELAITVHLLLNNIFVDQILAELGYQRQCLGLLNDIIISIFHSTKFLSLSPSLVTTFLLAFPLVTIISHIATNS